MPATSSKSSHFDALRSWLTEINGEKQAAGRGMTTHPSAKVPDETEKATAGERAAENDRDVKKYVPDSVDSSDPGKPNEDDVMKQIGMRPSATGEDPSVENNYTDRPKDSPTSSPISTHVGEKYSFDMTTTEGLNKAAAALGALANEILADIAVGQPTKQASSPSPAGAPSAPGGASALSQPAPLDAAQAGYEMAKLMGLSKEAADQTATNVLASTIKQANYLGERVATILYDLHKQAADAPPEDTTDGAEAGAPPDAGGGAPPPSGAEGPAGGADLGAALAGAEGGGAPGGEGDMSGGGGGQDQALQELAMALMELGVDPSALAAAVSGQGAGGAPGGAPGGDGGMPAGPGPEGNPAEMGGKIASAVLSYKRSGKFQVREAKSAAERQLRDQMKRYVVEILGATRSV